MSIYTSLSIDAISVGRPRRGTAAKPSTTFPTDLCTISLGAEMSLVYTVALPRWCRGQGCRTRLVARDAAVDAHDAQLPDIAASPGQCPSRSSFAVRVGQPDWSECSGATVRPRSTLLGHAYYIVQTTPGFQISSQLAGYWRRNGVVNHQSHPQDIGKEPCRRLGPNDCVRRPGVRMDLRCRTRFTLACASACDMMMPLHTLLLSGRRAAAAAHPASPK